MHWPLIVFTILLLAVLTEAKWHHHKFHRNNVNHQNSNSNPSAGYIFMGEQSICSCRENVVVSLQTNSFF